MSMTENMKAFVEHNKKHKVVCAEMLTLEGEPVLTDKDVENSDRSRYTFSDGSKIVLLSDDKLSAPDFKPIWDFGDRRDGLKKECTDYEAFWDYVNKLHQELEKLESMLIKIRSQLDSMLDGCKL